MIAFSTPYPRRNHSKAFHSIHQPCSTLRLFYQGEITLTPFGREYKARLYALCVIIFMTYLNFHNHK